MRIELHSVFQNAKLIIDCSNYYEIKNIRIEINLKITDDLPSKSHPIFIQGSRINLFELKYKIPLKALGFDVFDELKGIDLKLPDFECCDDISDAWLKNCYKYFQEATPDERSKPFLAFIDLLQNTNERSALGILRSSKSMIAKDMLFKRLVSNRSNNFELFYPYLYDCFTNKWLLSRILLSRLNYGYHRYLVLKKLTVEQSEKTKELLIYHAVKLYDLATINGNSNFRDNCLDYREIQVVLEYLSNYKEDKIKWIFKKEFLNKYSNCSRIICKTLAQKYDVDLKDLVMNSINTLQDKSKNFLYDSAIENLNNYSNFNIHIEGDEMIDILKRSKQLNYAGRDDLCSEYLRYVLKNYNHLVPHKLFSILKDSNDRHLVIKALKMLSELIVISSDKIPLRITSGRVRLIIGTLFNKSSRILNFSSLKCLSLLAIFKKNNIAIKTIFDIASNKNESSVNRGFAFSELNYFIKRHGYNAELCKLYEKNIDTEDTFLKVKIIKGLLFLNNNNKYREGLSSEINSLMKSCYNEYLSSDLSELDRVRDGLFDFHNIPKILRSDKNPNSLQNVYYNSTGKY